MPMMGGVVTAQREMVSVEAVGFCYRDDIWRWTVEIKVESDKHVGKQLRASSWTLMRRSEASLVWRFQYVLI